MSPELGAVFCIPADRVMAMWPAVESRVTEALEGSLHYATTEEILAQLLVARLGLLVVVSEEEISGIVVVEPHQQGSSTWLNLALVQLDSGAPRELLGLAIDAAAELGTKLGATALQFFSARAGAGNRAMSLGFRPRFAEFVRDIA